MASKEALVALVLVALVALAVARSESGRAVQLRHTEDSLGMKGGSPSGMQPSVTATIIPDRRIMIGHIITADLDNEKITLPNGMCYHSTRGCHGFCECCRLKWFCYETMAVCKKECA